MTSYNARLNANHANDVMYTVWQVITCIVLLKIKLWKKPGEVTSKS